MRRSQNFVEKKNVVLFNRMNHEQVVGDLINEDEIDGKSFFVMRVNGRVMKYSKEAFTTKKSMVIR